MNEPCYPRYVREDMTSSLLLQAERFSSLPKRLNVDESKSPDSRIDALGFRESRLTPLASPIQWKIQPPKDQLINRSSTESVSVILKLPELCHIALPFLESTERVTTDGHMDEDAA